MSNKNTNSQTASDAARRAYVLALLASDFAPLNSKPVYVKNRTK